MFLQIRLKFSTTRQLVARSGEFNNKTAAAKRFALPHYRRLPFVGPRPNRLVLAFHRAARRVCDGIQQGGSPQRYAALRRLSVSSASGHDIARLFRRRQLGPFLRGVAPWHRGVLGVNGCHAGFETKPIYAAIHWVQILKFETPTPTRPRARACLCNTSRPSVEQMPREPWG